MEHRHSIVIVGRGVAGKSAARARAVGDTLKIRNTLLRRLAHFELLQDRGQGLAPHRQRAARSLPVRG
jgi:hypothetical protein